MLNADSRNNNIDILKGIACIAVILIHYNWQNDVGTLIRTISRFAVPFFFFISGYYLLDSNNTITTKRLKIKIYHILKISIKAILFYATFCIIWHILMFNNWNFFDFINSKFTYQRLIKFIITNDPFLYAHLWFLFALIYCYIFSFFIKKLNNTNIILLIIFLVISFSALSEFNNFLQLNNFIKLGNDQYLIISNIFIFRSLPFFLVGLYFRTNQSKIKNYCDRYLLFIILIGLSMSVFERIFTKECQFYIGTYIVFLCLCKISISDITLTHTKLQYIGKNLSEHIYIYHIFIGKIIDLIYNKLSLYSVFFNFIRPFLIIILTIYFSYSIYLYTSRKNYKKGKII